MGTYGPLAMPVLHMIGGPAELGDVVAGPVCMSPSTPACAVCLCRLGPPYRNVRHDIYCCFRASQPLREPTALLSDVRSPA